MKKLFAKFTAGIAILLYFLNAQVVHAAEMCPPGFESLCSIKGDKIGGVVGGIINVILILATLACLFYLIWGGVRWTMSGGDQGKIAAARATIIAALIGLVVAFLAFVIVSVVLYIFTGESFNGFQLPKLV